MPNECNITLKYNHGEKSLKDPFMIYADLYGKKMPLYTFWLFIFYRGKDGMEKFCKDVREHTIRQVNYEKKKRNYTTN